jgi:L-malate glycosyltransferase
MKLRIPYIVSLRGSDVPFYNRRYEFLDRILFQRLSRRIWKNAKAVVANSEGLKELAMKTDDNVNIKVIPNGVDIEEFRPGKKKTERGNKKIIVISIGRLIERKGYSDLIEAISNMKNVELQLIGDGNLLDRLKSEARSFNSNVKFLGKKEHGDIPEFLKKADVFVLPSLNEGMSNAILEAMACGLPIITTDTGGSKELVKENGVIFRKGDVNELRSVLKKFEKDKTLIVKMGDISRRMVEEMSWDNVVQKYYEIYE